MSPQRAVPTLRFLGATGIGAAPRPPETVFLVHGEPAAADALRRAIVADLGWTVAVPGYLEKVRVD